MSMPIGPINTSAISRTLKHGYKVGLTVGAGAALMDVIYCGGSAQINEFLTASPIINLMFELAGFVALLFLGVRQLRSKLPSAPPDEEAHLPFHHQNKKPSGQSFFESFFIGILLYATNVMAVPEWIIISGLWRSWGILGKGIATNVFFALGAGAGTFGWFTVLIRWISRHHRGFKESTLSKINIGTGIAMLVFAGYFSYAILFETQWSQVQTHVKASTDKIIDSIK